MDRTFSLERMEASLLATQLVDNAVVLPMLYDAPSVPHIHPLYKILGQYAAISVVQGGCGYPFFHPKVYTYLCTGIWSPVAIPNASIPDPELRDLMSKVNFVYTCLHFTVVTNCCSSAC